MRLWRLSSTRHARDFTGGYAVRHSGRWNTSGRPVTYCSTVPSLAALEKRVHVTDPSLLPPQSMVEYEAPDDLPQRTVGLNALAFDWVHREVDTQRLGDQWLDSVAEPLLVVPSVIMQLPNAPDRNVLINHRHPDIARIRIVRVDSFELDPRAISAVSRLIEGLCLNPAPTSSRLAGQLASTRDLDLKSMQILFAHLLRAGKRAVDREKYW